MCLAPAQNQAANANNGDYRNNTDGRTRTAQEQHPIHLHGHHFWGKGLKPDQRDGWG